MKKIYFITVNFNSSDYTLRYIESIDNLSVDNMRCNVNIIIIDNASDQDDYLKIESICRIKKNIKLIRNEENIGYFKALNVGLECCCDTENSLHIIGNNDISFQTDFITELTKLCYDSKTLVIAPNIISRGGYHQNPHCVKKMSGIRKIGYKIYFSNYYLGKIFRSLMQIYKPLRTMEVNAASKKEQYIYMGVGALYILTDNFFQYYSKLDDRVFLWGEEALLAGQIDTVGGKMLYSPSLVVYHDESVSVLQMPSRKMYKIGQESYSIYKNYL